MSYQIKGVDGPSEEGKLKMSKSDEIEKAMSKLDRTAKMLPVLAVAIQQMRDIGASAEEIIGALCQATGRCGKARCRRTGATRSCFEYAAMSNNPVATRRRRLPDRRGSMTFTLQVGGLSFTATASRFDDGSLGEVFLNSIKQNSSLDAFAADAAILISLLLQRGASVAGIGHALSLTPTGEPASLIGAALAELGRLEKHRAA